ncbi:hypothetical protein PSPO01_14417 [Paraphaeosphaeria sporulosa]
MARTIDLAPEEQSPTVWSLRRMTRCDLVSLAHTADFGTVGDCELLLDRGNAEFGLLYPILIDDSISVAAQDDNGKPVYFKASEALALVNYQIEMEFEDVVEAQSFLAALKAPATAALSAACLPDSGITL